MERDVNAREPEVSLPIFGESRGEVFLSIFTNGEGEYRFRMPRHMFFTMMQRANEISATIAKREAVPPIPVPTRFAEHDDGA